MDCPVHVAFDQLLYLQHKFPDRWRAGKPDWDLPLFPTIGGEVPTKEAMVKTIEHAARFLEVTLAAPDGTERISGHSLRVTGVQGLSLLGWHLWTIQLMGRWGSDVVRTYLREAPLSAGASSHSTTSSSVPNIDLESLAAVLRAKWDQSMSAPSSSSLPPTLMPEAHELAQEVAELTEPSTSSSVTMPPLTPELVAADLLVNLSSGFTHRKRTDRKADCGWRYHEGRAALVPSLDVGPVMWGQCCRACFAGLYPNARSALDSEHVPWALAPP